MTDWEAIPRADIDALLAKAHPALQPVIRLHQPHPAYQRDCAGCDGGDEWLGAWPCRTIELILDSITEQEQQEDDAPALTVPPTCGHTYPMWYGQGSCIREPGHAGYCHLGRL